jgi:hypothetical protein
MLWVPIEVLFFGNHLPPVALNCMPRFYVHIKENDHLIRDEDGVDKPTVEDVRAEARSAARELWTDAIQTGADLDVEASCDTSPYLQRAAAPRAPGSGGFFWTASPNAPKQCLVFGHNDL